MNYDAFVASKLALPVATGIPDPVMPEEGLFPFQKVVSSWACKRGRAAIFASTGLGKSRMGAAWAQNVATHTGRDVIAFAPLAVAKQFRGEAARVGVEVTVCREEKDLRPGINVTNYERMDKFQPDRFSGVLIDEGSIIKHFDSATFRELCSRYSETPFRLSMTATPAPNDWMELGCQAEFLGICKRTEMLSEFFVHDGGDTSVWRLKGHARGAFWQWVASWAALVSHPRDLGVEFDQPGYDLPPLRLHEHVIPVDAEQARAAGLLFVEEARGLMEQRQARKASLSKRVEACARLVNADDDRWIVWSNLNAESEALREAIRGSVEVTGSQDVDTKERIIEEFVDGKHRVLDSKSSICGHGLNLQFVKKMAFVGMDNSWEQWFQAIRRIWRFGQTEPCDIHVFVSEAEGAVLENVKAKDAAAKEMAEALARETREAVRANVIGTKRTTVAYEPQKTMRLPSWLGSRS